MASNLESFVKKNVSLILGSVAVLILIMVALIATDFSIFKSAEPLEFRDYVVGTWEFTDREDFGMIFQFHPNGRYDFYPKISPVGSKFGEWDVVQGDDGLGVVTITPTEDPTMAANLYIKQIHLGAMDVRMGDGEGVEFTRFTRLENP